MQRVAEALVQQRLAPTYMNIYTDIQRERYKDIDTEIERCVDIKIYMIYRYMDADIDRTIQI